MNQLSDNPLHNTWPPEQWCHRRVLIALSGGPDSTALAKAIVELAPDKDRVAVAHFNHGWRGEESNSDERFASALASSLGVRFFCDRASHPENDAAPTQCAESDFDCSQFDFIAEGELPKSVHELNRSEQFARAQRYRFLEDAARSFGASYIALGHNAEDRAETLLHNLLRGSGPAGLASMRMFRSFAEDLVLVRPLLSVSRADILNFLSSRHQTYRVDSSNTNTDYARNFLRNTLMPLLADRYGDQVSRRLTDCSERIEESLVTIESLGKRLVDEARLAGRASASIALPQATSASAIVLDISALRKAPWPVTREGLRLLWLEKRWPLQSMTRAHWLKLRSWIRLSTSTTGEWRTVGTLPGAVVVVRGERCLLLHRSAD